MLEQKNKEVLIVEPDFVLAKLYDQSFNKHGFKVRLASNAQSAIDLIDDKKPDLIILEIQLTSHSGIEFLYELRSYSDLRDVPVVIYSVVPGSEFSDSLDTLMKDLDIREYFQKSSTSIQDLITKAEELIK